MASTCSTAAVNASCRPVMPSSAWRSEEHTSELQSHSDLVCRLLLEKKKKMPTSTPHMGVLGVHKAEATFHPDHQHHYIVQRYHAEVSSFARTSSYNPANRPVS